MKETLVEFAVSFIVDLFLAILVRKSVYEFSVWRCIC